MSEAASLLTHAVEAIGGVPREGQTTMAEAVASALDTGTHLLVQAGTGTGKSLGYLVPAVDYALRTGEKVIVSTATLALQTQIKDADLPRLFKTVKKERGKAPVAVVLKGRRNYVCKHKLDGGYPDDESGMLFDLGADAVGGGNRVAASGLGDEIGRVRTWERLTRTGDRDDLRPGVSDRAWSHVSVNSQDCLGSKCPLYDECYAELARRAAQDADIVVTNHALLAIDSFGDLKVLPERGAVVVDEAHELQDRVTNALSGAVSVSMLHAAGSAVRTSKLVQPGVVDLYDTAVERFDSALAETEDGLLRIWPERLGLAVAGVRDAARQLVADMGSESGTEADPSVTMAKARIQEVHELTERLCERFDNDVAWVSRSTFREVVTAQLVVAPISVAGTMRTGLFGESTVIATSATLALGGKFEPVAGSLGLTGPEAPRYDAIDVGSPFDYGRQGILYLAAHLDKPGREGPGEKMLAEVLALAEASRGGALGLFSSRAGARAAAEYLREHSDLPVLLQGEDSLASLVSDFAADPRACLFGTMSLWQGVNVPGATNRLVVIDRIPFPRPDDPLMQARTQAVARHGGNGFMSVSATHAALRLAQGAGRLIRDQGDKGVVAILDSRMVSARYAGFLRGSLPPMWTTSDRDVVLGALTRNAPAAD